MPRKSLKICKQYYQETAILIISFPYSYHHFYLGSKVNLFKNKSVLIEAIHKMKQEKIREKQLAEQREARRVKNVVKKEKRVNKKLEQMGQLKKADPVEKAPVAKKEEAAPQKEAAKKAAPKKDAPAEKQAKAAPKEEGKKAEPKAAPKKEAAKAAPKETKKGGAAKK
jgi:large subunit ribosomal protein L19e